MDHSYSTEETERKDPHKLTDATQMAAIAALHNAGSIDQFLIFYNDNTDAQLVVMSVPYSQAEKPVKPRPSHAKPQIKGDLGAAPGPADVPSGNISPLSALTAAPFKGTLNVYGVLNGKTAGNLLVCRLSPGFEFLNVVSPPLASAFSIAACSNGTSIGSLFFLGSKKADDIELYSLDLPGLNTTPTQVPGALRYNDQSYLGAAYGSLGNLSPQSYVVVQDTNGNLNLTSADGQVTAPVTQDIAALINTPIACLFIGNWLVVYYFGPATQQGSLLMRAATSNPTTPFTIVSRPSAPTPNGYTQLTAFIEPSTVNGSSGTAIVSYVQATSGEILPFLDHLSF